MFAPGGPKQERLIKIIPANEPTTVNFGIKVTTQQPDGRCRARVHCVDVNTRELVYAYLFDIETDKPLVSRSYVFEVISGIPQPFKFQFRNPLNEFAMLEIASSK